MAIALGTITPVIVSGLLPVFLSTIYTLCSRERGRQLPPGPQRLPLLGSIHQLPVGGLHLAFTQWGAQYGGVVYAEFFGQPIVILNSAQAAFDLVEKRGAKYSRRPRFPFFLELVHWNGNIAFSDYNDKWQRHRRWFRSAFLAKNSLQRYKPLQLREMHKLLTDLLQDPAGFRSHLRRFTSGVTLEIGYGHTITSLDDETLRVIDSGLEQALDGSGAGGSAVDLLPFLKYVPAWMPGAEFKRKGLAVRKSIRAMEDVPYAKVKEEMVAGAARPSFTMTLIEECLQKGQLTEEDEREIKGASGALYTGGADTTLTALVTFVLAMVQNPDVLKKAQDEVDRVVGKTRLPDFGVRDSLPYIDCIVREVYRTCPPVPLAIPHRAAEDDVYRGYHIPKDCTVFLNVWAMCKDPEVYPEPDAFRPERFSGMAGLESTILAFGTRGRVCPGRLLADGNIWLVVTSIIATMNICKARDECGEETTPSPPFLPGTVIQPGPFVCDIRPRSEKVRQLILSSGVDI